MFTHDCIVIGTGAAGYSCACRLKQAGVDVAIVTEGINIGTSRNTGSDKQTYYKLGLSGDAPDSVRAMAKNLFDGGCMDGDNALCEASLSARCFLNLCELGVPFPQNRYGEYIGYKTDHDPYERATSAGRLTSKFMTEALEKKARSLNIKIYDGYRVIKILKSKDRACGFIALKEGEPAYFRARDTVMATGGPAGIYADSVYPTCHRGGSGLAIDAGAKMQNLSLWQYGLASVNPRWNVSGTYMQVLPRFVSIDENGVEHDFLWDSFENKNEGLSLVFLKGYQWPYFEKNKSSVIDRLVYNERLKGRRVYLDYTKNPCDIDYSALSDEARGYLEKAGADFGRPIERLYKMNTPAIELYKSKGVDLYTEYLEIALCAQHNNGGVAVDCWWQSSVKGLYAIGECAGTHGLARPGGSALNSSQVGALRASQYISARPNDLVDESEFLSIAKGVKITPTDESDKISNAQRRMSDHGGALRDNSKIKELLEITLGELKTASDPDLYDILLTQGAVLSSMAEQNADPAMIQETLYDGGEFKVTVRPVRPIPDEDGFFENVWRSFRENKNIY